MTNKCVVKSNRREQGTWRNRLERQSQLFDRRILAKILFHTLRRNTGCLCVQRRNKGEANPPSGLPALNVYRWLAIICVAPHYGVCYIRFKRMRHSPHHAVYGQTRILRMYCDDCKGVSFVIAGRFACCDKLLGECPSDLPCKRESDVPIGRKGPSVKYRKAQLHYQHNRCFYCDLPFSSHVWRGSKFIALKVNWDHIDPYAYSLNNKDTNFVAACHICNGIKSSMSFRSLEDAQIYIQQKRAEKGYTTTMPEMRVRISPETELAKIL